MNEQTPIEYIQQDVQDHPYYKKLKAALKEKDTLKEGAQKTKSIQDLDPNLKENEFKQDEIKKIKNNYQSSDTIHSQKSFDDTVSISKHLFSINEENQKESVEDEQNKSNNTLEKSKDEKNALYHAYKNFFVCKLSWHLKRILNVHICRTHQQFYIKVLNNCLLSFHLKSS